MHEVLRIQTISLAYLLLANSAACLSPDFA